MHLKRVSIYAAAIALVIMASLPAAPASHDNNLKTEWYPYVANDLVLGVALAPCDTTGTGGVRFCATLQDPDSRPDRLLIDIREDAGPRVAGYYMFLDAQGDDIPASQGGQGYFCGAINHFVPATDWVINKAFDILLDEDTAGDLDASGAACGSPGTLGKVTVVWRYNAPVF
jgi:hypothetical protein